MSLLAQRHNAEGKPERDTAQASEAYDAGLAFYYSAVTPDCTSYCAAVTVPYILNLQSMLDVLV